MTEEIDMCAQLNDAERDKVASDQQSPINPLRRVFIPIEKRTSNGTIVFRTTDKQMYVRLADDSIRRATPKLRGKAARRADKLARRTK